MLASIPVYYYLHHHHHHYYYLTTDTHIHHCNLREGNWIYPGRIKPPPRAAFNPSAGGQQYSAMFFAYNACARLRDHHRHRLNRCVLKTSASWRAQGPPGNLANDILITRPRWYLYNIHHHYYHHHFGDKYSRFHRVYLSTLKDTRACVRTKDWKRPRDNL